MTDEVITFLGYEWVQLEDGLLTVGINEQGLEEFTEILTVSLPSENEDVHPDEVCGELETDQGPLNLYSPVEGVVVDVGADDLPVRLVMAHRNGNTARAGAQVERATDLASAEPRLETGLDQFGDRRTRHQRARVRLEAQAGKPGLATQIGGRNALVDAPGEQLVVVIDGALLVVARMAAGPVGTGGTGRPWHSGPRPTSP